MRAKTLIRALRCHPLVGVDDQLASIVCLSGHLRCAFCLNSAQSAIREYQYQPPVGLHSLPFCIPLLLALSSLFFFSTPRPISPAALLHFLAPHQSRLRPSSLTSLPTTTCTTYLRYLPTYSSEPLPRLSPGPSPSRSIARRSCSFLFPQNFQLASFNTQPAAHRAASQVTSRRRCF